MVRRYVIGLTIGICAAVAFIRGIPLRAGPQSAAVGLVLLPGDGRTATRLPDGRLLLIGGVGSEGSLAVVDSIAQTTVPLVTRLHQPRAGHAATVLPSGAILITGGVDTAGRPIAAAERFDLATETVAPVAMPGAASRAGHTATLLTDGRVFLAGGIGEDKSALSLGEIWTLESGAFVSVPGLQARSGHTAALRADGRVQLSGGLSASGERVPDDDIFDPRRGRGRRNDGRPVEQGRRLIAESQPHDGARAVPLDAGITLRFSHEIQPNALNDQTIQLSGSDGPVPARVIVAENGRLAFVWPFDRLRADTTFQVTVANTVDTTGAWLVGDRVAFTTIEAPTTSGPDQDDVWTPNPSSPGAWRTDRPQSPWQSLAALQAEPGVTAVAGQVLTLDGRPLRRVTLRIEDEWTRTDDTGRFLLRVSSTGAGRRELEIDGATANQGSRSYGFFEYGLTLEAGKTTVLPFTIWMPRLDRAHEVSIPSPTVAETVITTPYIPGLELHLPPRTVIRDKDGAPVTRLGITPIPVDRPPFPLAKNVEVPVYFTVQPGGAYVRTYSSGPSGAWLVYPNYGRTPAGQVLQFFHYDPDDKDWYVYGVGTVTADAAQVVPDSKTRLYEFTGAMLQTGDPVPGGGWLPGAPGRGDPVDPSTGVFAHSKTDLYLPDVLPLALTRTYNSADTAARPFGRGTTHPYAMFLWSAQQWQQADLILPDGGRVHYVRTSAGTSWVDAVFVHQETATTSATPTVWYKSVITWNGNGWNLQRTDGMVFVFGENAPLQSIRDRFGNTVSIVRTSGQRGNITRITSPNGRWIVFSYDGANRVTQATDNIGRTVRYAYDGAGNLSTVTDPENGVTTHGWTVNQLSSITDPRNIVFLRNTYTNGRVTAQVGPDGSATTQFIYTTNAAGAITQTEIVDPRGNRERLVFNADRYIVSATSAVGTPQQRTETFERLTGSNFVAAAIDGLGRRTEFAYDASGNIVRETRLAETAQAVTTTLTYEPRFFQPASMTDPMGHVTQFSYDTAGRLTGTTDAVGRRVGISLDANGRVARVSNALQHSWQFTYRGGDPTGWVDPLNAAFGWFADAAGRIVAASDPLGYTARVSWNRVNQMVAATDATGGQTRWNHDGNGNLLEVVDARGNATRYSYDAFDRMASRTDPVSQVESREYDANSNLVRVVDRRGQATTYQYDALDRLSLATFADGSTIAYAYDAGDRLLQVTDSANGTLAWQYDQLDRVIQESTPAGSVGYNYDADGLRTAMTVAGQSSISYVYDAAHQLTSIASPSAAVGLTHDDAGRTRSLALPNGIVADYAYDAAHRLTSLAYSLAGVPLGDLHYTYDAVGSPIYVDGSLARTVLPAPVPGATYDAANRLIVRSGTAFSYDANGNMTSDGLHSFQWSARNLLASISGGVQAMFQYDGIGRRRSRSAGGTTTRFLYEGLNVVQEQSGSGAVEANLVTGLRVDETFLRTDSNGVSTFLTDVLGSTLALAGASGDVRTQYAYEPFGKTTATGSASTNAVQFTGRENDGTGLYFYRARYYSPELGRFLSEDPLGFDGGDSNLYAYVGNAPTKSIDPLGLYGVDVHYGLTGAIGRQVGLCAGDARRIAHANQMQDVWPWTKPTAPQNVLARALYHFTTPSRLGSMRQRAMERGSLGAMGRYLHALQDSYSHQRGRKDRDGEPYGPVIGHMHRGTTPDNPRDRPDLWRHMADTTARELSAFHRAFPGCHSR